MEMFLMVLCISLLGVGVSAALFAAATAEERRREARQPLDRRLVAESPQRFFTVPAPALPVQPGALPVDVLLLRLEQHIRLEQAAAETFHQFPTPESLHTRTVSPLLH
jgi:hypothetical protein